MAENHPDRLPCGCAVVSTTSTTADWTDTWALCPVHGQASSTELARLIAVSRQLAATKDRQAAHDRQAALYREMLGMEALEASELASHPEASELASHPEASELASHPEASDVPTRRVPDPAAVQRELDAREARIKHSTSDGWYTSPYVVSRIITGTVIPAFHDDWRTARERYVTAQPGSGEADQAYREMLEYVTLDNPPLASDSQDAPASPGRVRSSRRTVPYVAFYANTGAAFAQLGLLVSSHGAHLAMHVGLFAMSLVLAVVIALRISHTYD